jgi:hypothetical protein
MAERFYNAWQRVFSAPPLADRARRREISHFTVPTSAIPILCDPPFVFFLFLLAAGIGYRVLRLLRVPANSSKLESGVLAMALGVGLLQVPPFLLGATGHLTPTAITVTLILLAVLFSSDAYRVVRSVIRYLQAGIPRPQASWITAAAALLFVLVFLAFLQALCPPTDPDGLGYHLQTPKRWLQIGSIGYLPTLVQTQSPMGVEMLYTIALAVWSDTAAKLIHFGLGLLAFAAVFALGRRVSNSAAGFAAMALFAIGIPKNYALSEFSLAYIDLGLTFEVVSAVLAWILWKRSGARGWLFVSALCTGFAISFKLTAWPLGFIIGVMTYLSLRKQAPTQKSAAALTGAWLFISALPAVPWLLRSWVLTGNPVWPLFSSIIPTRDWSPSVGSAYFHYMHYDNWGGSLAGWTDHKRDLVLLIAALVVLLAAYLVWRKWKYEEGRDLIVITAALALVSIATTGLYLRFFLPIFALMFVILCACMATWIKNSKSFQLVLVGILGVNALLYLRSSSPHPLLALKTAAGVVDRESYLQQTLPTYPLWVYVNAKVPGSSRILVTGFGACYYSNATCFVADPVTQGRFRMDTWEHFVSDVRNNGVGYIIVPDVLVPPRHGGDWQPARNEIPFAKRLAEEEGTPLISAGGNALYQLKPPLSTD